MNVTVAVKQVPATEALALGPDGRLSRHGVALEMSAYCRRALAKGIELARATGGSCRVFSLGPPSAERVLREALACGADEAVLLCDQAFAGSDTLVTARALAALVKSQGPADLLLVGKASLDAETGQVGPQLAELLDLPFAGAVRSLDLDIDARTARVLCEQDDGGCELVVKLPAVLAVAERCCRPAKAGPAAIEAVPRGRVVRLCASDLTVAGPWGELGSPTKVEKVVPVPHRRGGVVCAGPVAAQVDQALCLLEERHALGSASGEPHLRPQLGPVVPVAGPGAGPVVAVLVEPGRWRLGKELLGMAAKLARDLGGSAVAVVLEACPAEELWSSGADASLQIVGADVEEDVARALATWAADACPEVVLAPATPWGREVAARAAARIGAGLVADTVDIEISGGRLRCTKPVGAAGAMATILTSSAVQMATVRPGALAPPLARPGGGRLETKSIPVLARRRVEVIARWREDDAEALERARVVIGVGLGVSPEHYGEVRSLAKALGAELGATRKVTDRGLLPRSRQIGITGRNIAPCLYVAFGISGSPNHLAGVRCAGTVLAVNYDPSAPIFAASDIGVVGDWRQVTALLLGHFNNMSPVNLAPLKSTLPSCMPQRPAAQAISDLAPFGAQRVGGGGAPPS